MTLLQKLKSNSQGLTLIELSIAIAVIGVLACVAVPSYLSYRNNAKIFTAIDEMKLIEFDITNYVYEYKEYPDSLSDIGKDNLIDPWGNPYCYLRLDGGTATGVNGKRRRDKNANSVNSDYDLYSMGKDGKTTAQFTGKKARDDIVRANDDIRSRLLNQFKSITLFSGSNQPRPLLNQLAIKSLELEPEDLKHMSAGYPFLVELNVGQSSPSIIILRQFHSERATKDFFVGEINLNFLWGNNQLENLPMDSIMSGLMEKVIQAVFQEKRSIWALEF